jgi:hypothetical protein
MDGVGVKLGEKFRRRNWLKTNLQKVILRGKHPKTNKETLRAILMDLDIDTIT